MTDEAAPAAAEVLDVDSPPAAQVASPPPARQPLKLVVLLQPEGDGYRALLSLGREGCDPELRSAQVDDLAAALDEVPALLAEAETRWASRPRFPAAVKPRATAGAFRTGPAATPAVPAPPSPATPSTAPATPAPPPTAGQLGLFR